MKIRQDFVSNSSSSSFVLWGASIPLSQIVEQYRKIKGHENETEDDIYGGCAVDDVFGGCPFEYVYDEDSECTYCGFEPTKMKDTETLLQFKERIVDKFKELGMDIKTSDIKFYSGVNADGIISLA